MPGNTSAKACRAVLPANGDEGGDAVHLIEQEEAAHGNDVAGIRLPDVAVPLATYTGWALRAVPADGDDHVFAPYRTGFYRLQGIQQHVRLYAATT